MSNFAPSLLQAFAIAAIIAVALLIGLFANSIVGNPVIALIAAALIGLVGFLAMRAGSGWLQGVCISLLVFIVAAMAYGAWAFWRNYG